VPLMTAREVVFGRGILNFEFLNPLYKMEVFISANSDKKWRFRYLSFSYSKMEFLTVLLAYDQPAMLPSKFNSFLFSKKTWNFNIKQSN